MTKNGIVKQTEDGWVIEYHKIHRHAGLSKMGTGPAASGNRGRGRMCFEDCTIPIASESEPLCIEGAAVEFEIIHGFGKIYVHEPVPHTDWTIGLLMGEIIWCRKLKMHTEDSMLRDLATTEEKAEYKRLEDIWSDGGNYGKTKDEAEKDQDWENYRAYARSLDIKYLPNYIEYSEFVPFDLTDMESFFKGVRSYLWDTDHCHYVFKQEDISLKREPCMKANLLKIKFTLDYLVEKEK